MSCTIIVLPHRHLTLHISAKTPHNTTLHTTYYIFLHVNKYLAFVYQWRINCEIYREKKRGSKISITKSVLICICSLLNCRCESCWLVCAVLFWCIFPRVYQYNEAFNRKDTWCDHLDSSETYWLYPLNFPHTRSIQSEQWTNLKLKRNLKCLPINGNAFTCGQQQKIRTPFSIKKKLLSATATHWNKASQPTKQKVVKIISNGSHHLQIQTTFQIAR